MKTASLVDLLSDRRIPLTPRRTIRTMSTQPEPIAPGSTVPYIR